MFRTYLQETLLTYIAENGLKLLGKAGLALLAFLGGYIVINIIVQKVRNKLLAQSIVIDEYSQKLAKVMGSIVFVGLMVINVLFVFSVLGADVALVIGALSVAVGFAMETTIKNMISGILLLTNKKNKLGQFVEVLGSYNLRATIEEITLRHTVFRTIQNQRIIIPNGMLAETPIKTIKIEPVIRGKIEIKVPRHVNLDQVKQMLLDTVNANEKVISKEYTSVAVTGFDAQGIGLQGLYYMSPEMGGVEFSINSKLRIALSKLFKQYGITPPYLNITVDVE